MLEVAYFIWLYRKQIIHPLPLPNILLSNNERLIVVLGFGIFICLYIFQNILNPTIFYSWDAVVSWNRWATQWAQGEFVINEGGYSQLYPMLLSLGYVSSGKISDFQAIGVAIYWYFAFIGIVAAVFLCSIQSSSQAVLKSLMFGIILGIVVCIVFFRINKEFYVGYVDMPVAMIILISALCLLQIDFIKSSATSQAHNVATYLILGALAAGISTQIKQAGLFWCIIYIIGSIYLYIRYPQYVSKKVLGVCIAIIVLFSAPWFIIAIYKKAYLQANATNVDWVMHGIFFGASYLERLMHAISHYKSISALFALGLLSLSLKQKMFGFLGLFGFLYFIFWGTHLSYDLRNLQGGIPLMAIAISGMIFTYAQTLITIGIKILRFCYRYMVLGFMLIVPLGMIIAGVNQKNILAKEYKRKLALGGTDTQIVLEAFNKYGEKPLITHNQPLAYASAFDKKYYRHFSFGKHIQDGIFESFVQNIIQKEKHCYILIPRDQAVRYGKFLARFKTIAQTQESILLECTTF